MYPIFQIAYYLMGVFEKPDHHLEVYDFSFTTFTDIQRLQVIYYSHLPTYTGVGYLLSYLLTYKGYMKELPLEAIL